MKTLDVETTGLDYDKDHIIGLASCEKKKGTYAEWSKVDKVKLAKIMNNEEIVEHNAKFDTHMFKAEGGLPIPKRLYDTMIVTHLLDENGSHALEPMAVKYLGVEPWKHELKQWLKDNGFGKGEYDKVPAKIVKPYAIRDGLYTDQLARKTLPMVKSQKMWDLFLNEMELTKVVVDVESRGVLLDVPYLKRLEKKFAPQQAKLEKEVYKLAGHAFNVEADAETRAVLYDELKLPILTRTAKEKLPSIDVRTLAKLKHPIGKKLIELSEIIKLRNTYCLPYIERTKDSDGLMHCEFDQLGARTGRFSSRNPNLQNVPRKGRGVEIRKAFITRPGYYNFYFDYSQMELVIYAHFSKDPFITKAVLEKRDIHSEMATLFYGRSTFTEDERTVIKTINFGFIYGMGANGLSKKLDIPIEQAFAIRNRYVSTFPSMKTYTSNLADQARQDGCITNPFGRKRKIPTDKAYISTNSLVQGTCSDILKHSMVKIHKLLANSKSHILLTIHDELVVEVHQSELEVVPQIQHILQDHPQFCLPLSQKTSFTNKSWADKKTWEGKIK
jgi:DNA polymerase I